MVGRFGLLSDPHDSHVPFERLTTAHPVIDCFALHCQGLLAPGATAILEIEDGRYPLAADNGKIWIGDQAVELVWHPALAARVFICPACRHTRHKLFRVAGRWCCYRCGGLTHASRHRNRMLKGWHRMMLLRRRIGASLVPFSPIEPKPLYRRRYWHAVVEIRQIEGALIGYLREDIGNVLERRDARESRS